MTSLLCFYRQGRCTTYSLYELVWEEPYLSLVSPSRAAGVYKAAPCCLQCYLLKRVLMPHTHSCLFNPVHTFRASQCVCCKDLHNQRRHELTLRVAQLPLMKLLKCRQNSVGRFHTLDAGSRKFEDKYLQWIRRIPGSITGHWTKRYLGLFSESMCFPSSVSLDQRSVNIYVSDAL